MRKRHGFPLFPLLGCALSIGVAVSSCAVKPPLTDGTASPQAAIANAAPAASTVLPEDKAIPRYDHIFVIIEENKAYNQIIDNPNAPIINELAKTYGLATHFYGEVHPSEANYIAMLGGSTFGIHDDDAFYCQPGSGDQFCGDAKQLGYKNHTIASPSLVDQLEAKGLTWKGYFEDLPAPGSKAVFAPDPTRALYAVKHNGFMNFKRVQDDPKLAQKVVGLAQLTADLQSGNLPNYSHIVFNQCHEMHGLRECNQLQPLIKTADTMIGQVVQQITQAPFWSGAGNNAIVITWDEDNNPISKNGTQGCCGYDPTSPANFGGGHIVTLVITNHGPRHVIDNTPYNHYSLLRTTEDAFGIFVYLNEAGAITKGVKPMTPLFSK